MASLAESLVGHKSILVSWSHAFNNQALSHAFLLIGPDGVGRKLLAIAFFQQVNCERPTYQAKACGLCGSCVRIASVQKGQTESMLILSPQKNQIKIEDTRQVQDFLSLSKVSKARAVIIEDAHLLNPQAGNFLLKILEEPPPDTYFFLIAPTPAQVLPTLRSRSQIVSFSGLSSEEMKELLPAAPAWVLKASRGSVAQAKSLLNKDFQEMRSFALTVLRWWQIQENLIGHEEIKSNLKDRESALQIFRFIQSYLRDILVLQSAYQNEDLLNPDQKNLLLDMAEKVDSSRVAELSRWMLSLEQAALRQDDLVLQFERVWISCPSQAKMTTN